MRYFLHIGFEGTHFSGWQRQSTPRATVQGIIETVLFKLFKTKVNAIGCGRTDAGVHASQYIVQIDLEKTPDFDLKFRLNKNLPDSIAVFEIIEVAAKQHARFNATSRTYDYFIHQEKDPVLIRYSSFYEDLDLDYELMHECAKLIGETKDFRPLCKQPDVYKNTLCYVSNCELFVNPLTRRLRFTISSNRFLRGMVRYCIYYLLEVGSRKITLAEFKEILAQKTEVVDKRPALPNGLFLSRVVYPFLELKEAHSLIRMLKTGLD